jgi:hypothetical protein
MSNSFRSVTLSETKGVLVLRIALERVNSYEIAEAMGRELITAVRDKQSPGVVWIWVKSCTCRAWVTGH